MSYRQARSRHTPKRRSPLGKPPPPPPEPEIVLCNYGDLASRAPACESPPADGEDQCDYHLYVLHERGY